MKLLLNYRFCQPPFFGITVLIRTECNQHFQFELIDFSALLLLELRFYCCCCLIWIVDIFFVDNCEASLSVTAHERLVALSVARCRLALQIASPLTYKSSTSLMSEALALGSLP